MSEASISAISLPRAGGRSISNRFAKQAFCQLLQQVQTGSVILHDGEETLEFGAKDDSEAARAEIRVHNPLVYREILLGGTVGAGESYMQGHWSSPDTVAVVRVFTANMAILESMDAKQSWRKRLGLAFAHLLNNNTLSGSRRNISAHYDLGNDFFELFLDRSMMYSAAVFPSADASLEVAAEHKLELLCQQLKLKPDDHLLEIGTGWGGMAIYAASHYGCRVTTTTISREQYEYAQKRVEAAGLSDRITLLCEDYRALTGQYDKLVSVEMIEAVGHQFYQTYFQKCSSLLKPEGLMAIQAITMADQRYEEAVKSVDFIKRYIFPGGCLPSIEVISKHLARDTDMQMVHLRDITQDYADTLACWRERFMDKISEVRAQGFDNTFERMWDFYLCYCEGGFRERVIGTVQLTFAKPGYRFD